MSGTSVVSLFALARVQAANSVLKDYNATSTNGTHWFAPRLSWFKDVNITPSNLNSKNIIAWDGTKWVNKTINDVIYEFINIDGGITNENYSGIGEQIDGGFPETIF